jgi:hypothetical protein
MFRFGIKHIHKSAITTDMETLTRKWKFATDKKLEIEMLQVRRIQKRISWKCIAWIENSIIYGAGYISTLLDDYGW